MALADNIKKLLLLQHERRREHLSHPVSEKSKADRRRRTYRR